MTALVQESLFDYTQLDTETRIVVRQRTEEIKVLVRRSAQDIIDIGGKLIDVKTRLGHGNFGGWLKAEFGWGRTTAHKFMQISEGFSNVQNSEHLNLSFETMAYLAAPSTPEEIRIEAIERAQAGEVITHKEVVGMVSAHKEISRATELPPNATPIKLTPPLAKNFISAQPASDVIETSVRFVRAQPISIDEYEDDVQEIEDEDDSMADYVEPTYVAPAQSKPHVSHNSGNNEWYTPKEYIAAARSVLGWIDLDPATSELANTIVQADEFYTAADDGLAQQWTGKVWMNPPYAKDLVVKFAEKLCYHFEQGDVTDAIVLVNNATETRWFQRMAQSAACVCFPKSRVKFWQPPDEDTGEEGETGGPLQGQAILYFGIKVPEFVSAFSPFGFVGVIDGI